MYHPCLVEKYGANHCVTDFLINKMVDIGVVPSRRDADRLLTYWSDKITADFKDRNSIIAPATERTLTETIN